MAPAHTLAKLEELGGHVPLRQPRNGWCRNVHAPFAMVAMTRRAELKKRLPALTARPSRVSDGEEKYHQGKWQNPSYPKDH
jgi:hypothetical protein